jgi:hypothetical protein
MRSPRNDPVGSARRARQIENQRRSRERNERVIAGSVAVSPILGLVCECGHDGCTLAIVLTGDEYDAVRAHPQWFAVAPEHVIPDVDIVRSRHLRFVVVETPDA